MQTVKFKVKCSLCQHANVIAVSEEVLGRHSLRKCAGCLQLFPFTSPSREKINQLIKGQQQNVGTAGVDEKLEDEFKTTITAKAAKAENILVLEWKANENGRLQRFEVRQPYMTLGRLSDEAGSYRADIALESSDAYLSRKHAIIKKYSNSYTLSDAGSANGTYHNGNRIDIGEELVLSDGDRVLAGKTIIQIRIIPS